MTIEKEGLSTAESLRKTRTYGKFRCHNPTCMERIQPEKGKRPPNAPYAEWNIGSTGSIPTCPVSEDPYGT